MVHRQLIALSTALSLLEAVPPTLAHGDDVHGSEARGTGTTMATAIVSAIPSATANPSVSMTPESYFSYPAMSGLMFAHIIVMTVAWFFILPLGWLNPDSARNRHG